MLVDLVFMILAGASMDKLIMLFFQVAGTTFFLTL